MSQTALGLTPRSLPRCAATGKIQYATQFNAVKALRSFCHAHRGGDPRLNVYCCPYCDWWHVGKRGIKDQPYTEAGM